MRMLMRSLAVAAAVALVCTASGAPAEAKPTSRPRRHPAHLPIKDIEGLPRVLLMGDSISTGYTLPVRALLKGKANVHRIPINVGSTAQSVKYLTRWLGDGEWDLIHFNWGMHDLSRMPDGKHNVSIEDYVTVGAYSGVHQFCRLGFHAFIGGYTVITKDALPYFKSVGNRARVYGVNTLGLRRRGLGEEAIAHIQAAFRILFQSHLNTTQALARLKDELGDREEVARLMTAFLEEQA